MMDPWNEGCGDTGTGGSIPGVAAGAAPSVSLAPPSLPALPFPVFAVNREYLYKFIAEISKLARIPFFPELLALLGTPGAGDLHLPSGLRRRYKSIQSQSQSQVLGRARNSGGPRAGNRVTPCLYFVPVPFLWAGEAVPGWSRPGLSPALSEEVLDFPFPCSCLCLPCPTRMRWQLRGIWVEMLSFPDIFLDVMFSKPFLYPAPSPGIRVAAGAIPAGTSRSPALPGGFPARSVCSGKSLPP